MLEEDFAIHSRERTAWHFNIHAGFSRLQSVMNSHEVRFDEPLKAPILLQNLCDQNGLSQAKSPFTLLNAPMIAAVSASLTAASKGGR